MYGEEKRRVTIECNGMRVCARMHRSRLIWFCLRCKCVILLHCCIRRAANQLFQMIMCIATKSKIKINRHVPIEQKKNTLIVLIEHWQIERMAVPQSEKITIYKQSGTVFHYLFEWNYAPWRIWNYYVFTEWKERILLL